MNFDKIRGIGNENNSPVEQAKNSSINQNPFDQRIQNWESALQGGITPGEQRAKNNFNL